MTGRKIPFSFSYIVFLFRVSEVPTTKVVVFILESMFSVLEVPSSSLVKRGLRRYDLKRNLYQRIFLLIKKVFFSRKILQTKMNKKFIVYVNVPSFTIYSSEKVGQGLNWAKGRGLR